MGETLFRKSVFNVKPEALPRSGFTMGGGLKSLRGLTKSIPAANRSRGPLGGVKHDFTRLIRK